MNPATVSGPAIGPVPIEFILFGLVLAGVALFHAHTLRIALGGAIVIALYKIVFSPFKTGAGLPGFGSHLSDSQIARNSPFLRNSPVANRAVSQKWVGFSIG